MSERIAFGQEDIFNAMADMDDEALDELSFGAIQLDSLGTILQYNAAEGAITGRDPSQMVGRNFFREVAPCTRSPEFYGKFMDGVQAGHLDTVFEYTFDYRMTPTTVKVHM
ncbi:MAG: photoactive yellow protein, partial [Thiohalorhabdaceae bacterium]